MSTVGALLAALFGGGAGLAATPYLARLSVSAADPLRRDWWRGAPASRRRTAAVAVTATGFGALAGTAAAWTPALPAFLVFALAGTPLIVVDCIEHRLPNRLVALAAAGGVVLLAFAAALEAAWADALRAVEAAGLVFAVLFALALVAPRSLGLGDVKLAAVVAGYLGWRSWMSVFYGLFAAFLLGAVLAAALLCTRRLTLRTAIPFGPMLVLGPLLVLSFDLAPVG